MSKFIFLDTNNWIYLSNGFNILSNKHDELHLKIFEQIKSWADDGRVTFLINDIILEEWERNKDQATKQIKELENKHKAYSNTLNSIKDFIGHSPKELLDLQGALDKGYSEKTTRHKEHIKSVEDFIKSQPLKIDIGDKIKIEASNLALAKKAPFIGDKKNSMADAIILLSSLDHIYQNERMPLNPFSDSESEEYTFPESFFVSSNKGDFSAPDKKENIHPDLEPFLDKTNTKFFFTLGKLVNSLEMEFLTEEEEEILEHLDERLYCDICDYNYYPTVDFSQFFEVYDPSKKVNNKNQLSLDLPENKTDKDSTEHDNSAMSKIRTADCSHCSSEYIECTCGELVLIDRHNSKITCESCYTKYIVHADMDRKGMIHNLDYEIVEEFKCEHCGDEFESVNDNNLCEECAEYERISNEK